MLSADDPYACVDLDVKNAGNAPADPSSWTSPEQLNIFNKILDGLDSYAELSQSGQGLHIWVRGKIGKGLKREGVELYSQERFIACTGNVLRNRPIKDRTLMVINMAAQMRSIDVPTVPLTEVPPTESDCAHWSRKAGYANGTTFVNLWNGIDPKDGRQMRLPNGDWRSDGHYPSQSEADFALMGMLVFNNPSNSQCRRLFRQSCLGRRPKAQQDDRYIDLMLSGLRGEEANRRERAQLACSAIVASALASTKGRP